MYQTTQSGRKLTSENLVGILILVKSRKVRILIVWTLSECLQRCTKAEFWTGDRHKCHWINLWNMKSESQGNQELTQALSLSRKPKGPVFSLEHEGCCGIFIPHCHMGKKLQTFPMEGSRNSSISNLNLGYFLEISLLSLILHSPSHLTSLHTDLNV